MFQIQGSIQEIIRCLQVFCCSHSPAKLRIGTDDSVPPKTLFHKFYANSETYTIGTALALTRGMNTYPEHTVLMSGSDAAEGISGNRLTVRGILIPVDWDDEGHVTAVAVSTRNEIEYLVDKNEQWKGLLALIRKEVEVTGIVKEGDSQRTISVREFRLKPPQET